MLNGRLHKATIRVLNACMYLCHTDPNPGVIFYWNAQPPGSNIFAALFCYVLSALGGNISLWRCACPVKACVIVIDVRASILCHPYHMKRFDAKRRAPFQFGHVSGRRTPNSFSLISHMHHVRPFLISLHRTSQPPPLQLALR
jgi:hypothetical protein